MKRRLPDWAAIEAEVRAGLLSNRAIAEKYGISETSVRNRIKDRGLTRRSGRRTAQRAPKPGFVYVVAIEGRSGAFKVGNSVTPFDRLSTLQTSVPFELRFAVCYYSDDCVAEEAAVQKLFSESKIRGEWYELSAEDLRRIAARALVSLQDGEANGPES